MSVTFTPQSVATSIVDPTSIASTAVVTASVGDVILVVIGASNSGTSGAAPTITSIVDDAGGSSNVYYQIGDTGLNSAGGVTNDGICHFMYECRVTTALTNNIITTTFAAAVAQVVFLSCRIQPAASEIVERFYIGPVQNNTSTAHAAVVPVLAPGDTAVCFVVVQTNDTVTADSDTTRGSWSGAATVNADDVGGDPDSVRLRLQSKTVNAYGNQFFSNTTVSSWRSCNNSIMYRSVVPGYVNDKLIVGYKSRVRSRFW